MLIDGAGALTEGACALTEGAGALTEGAGALTDGMHYLLVENKPANNTEIGKQMHRTGFHTPRIMGCRVRVFLCLYCT